jgi:hypothetical protein
MHEPMESLLRHNMKGGVQNVPAYQGVTGTEHQTNFNSFRAKGFRMISLSVYDDPSDAHYGAVWVERPGSTWVAVD